LHGQPALARIRWHRVWATTAVVAACVVALITLVRFEYAVAYLDPGIDYETLMRATRSFLAGDGFYPERQLAGPWEYYQNQPGLPPAILYPPDALVLFIPFAFLPKILWWAIPFTITAWALHRLRPHPAAWLAIVLLLGIPESREGIFWGNPVMWMVAAEAAGFVLGWPTVFVLLKPTLAPFALAGAWHRSWRVALGTLAVANLAFVPMWADWVVVIGNSELGPGFSLYQYPLMAVPVVAWLGSRSGPIIWRFERWQHAHKSSGPAPHAGLTPA
jgi:hypothetical protein